MPRFVLALLAILLASSMVVQAQPAPALDYGRFLDNRFYVNRGTFAFGTPKKDFMLFPPPVEDPYSVEGAYIIRDSGGQVVMRQDIGVVQPTGSEAVLVLQTSGPPPEAPLPAGIYTLSIEFEGHTLGSFPFNATVEDGGDPFDPKTIWTLDGPWRTHAYFDHETERPDYIMNFNAWVAADELNAVSAPTEVSIRRDGEEVAFGYTHVSTNYGWGRGTYRLFKAEGREDRFARHKVNTPNWTAQDITPGTYEIVLSTEAGPFRTFTIEGSNGAFVSHPDSDINAPRERFLTPRRFEGQNLSRPHTLNWTVRSSSPE